MNDLGLPIASMSLLLLSSSRFHLCLIFVSFCPNTYSTRPAWELKVLSSFGSFISSWSPPSQYLTSRESSSVDCSPYFSHWCTARLMPEKWPSKVYQSKFGSPHDKVKIFLSSTCPGSIVGALRIYWINTARIYLLSRCPGLWQPVSDHPSEPKVYFQSLIFTFAVSNNHRNSRSTLSDLSSKAFWVTHDVILPP